jgi:hypothetical protein
MNVLRLKANKCHPTSRKLERVIDFLEHIKLDFEWVEGVLKVRDHQFACSFDLVREDDGKPMSDLPPVFEYKLTRDKIPNKYCKCSHCNSARVK